MDLVRALEILDIEDVNKVSKQDIKKKYRRLMMLNHPDRGGDEAKAKLINEAETVVNKAIEAIEVYKSINQVRSEPLCIISILSLVDIYKGGSVKIRFEDSEVNLSRRNLGQFKLMLDTTVKIVINGVETEYSKLFMRNNQDVYDFSIPVTVESLNHEETVDIKIGNKSVKITLSNNTSVMINLGFNVNVRVNLERKIPSDEN